MATKYNHIDFKAQLDGKNISFFITAASFERRSIIIPEIIKDSLGESIIFYNNNEYPEIVQNAEYIYKSVGNATKIQLNSDEPVSNLMEIFSVISHIAGRDNNPNILIDTTTFTHETLMVLVKLIELKKSELGAVYIAYVGAECYSVNEPDDSKKWLSKGIKTIRTVLGYSGFTDPTKKNHLVILFGFESERTKRIIEEYEYEYVTLGFGKIDGSIQTNHQKINYERHRKLLEEYPNANDFSFSLINPYEAKDDILGHLSLPQYQNLNTVIAPLNNKLSTIGACLASIANENIQLSYAKPLVYNVEGYSEPNQDIYFFRLDFE